MVLNPQTRQKLFEQAKACHPILGGIVQNEMDITPAMIAEEMRYIEILHSFLNNYAEALNKEAGTS